MSEQRTIDERGYWLVRALDRLYRWLPLMFACVCSGIVERRGARPAEVAIVFFLALIAAQMERK